MKQFKLTDDQISILKQVSDGWQKGVSPSQLFKQYGIDLKTFNEWQKLFNKMKARKQSKNKSKEVGLNPRYSTLKIKDSYLARDANKPRQLKSNVHFNAWCYYWQGLRDTGKSEKDAFNDFLEITQKEAYILSDWWIDISKPSTQSYSSKFMQNVIDAAKKDALDTENLKGIHLVTDQDVKRIIQALVSIIENNNYSQKQKDNVYSFIKKLRTSIIPRGKESWDAIGYYQYFQWRDSDDILGYEVKRLSKDFDWEKEGLLKAFGYHVGESSSLTPYKRSRILASLFEGKLGNYKAGLEDEWGSACSSERLRKITHSIAYFAKSKKGIPKDYRQAINDWEDDLQFLYDKYYKGFFDFDFPRI